MHVRILTGLNISKTYVLVCFCQQKDFFVVILFLRGGRKKGYVIVMGITLVLKSEGATMVSEGFSWLSPL